MKHLTGAAAFAAAAMITAFANPATAQRASFCNGQLVTNSSYTSVMGRNTTANVEYVMQIQTRNPNHTVTADMIAPSSVSGFTVQRPGGRLVLGPYEQKMYSIMTLQIANSVGSGAPTLEQVFRSIQFVCTFADPTRR
jgi:hypothetical protein